jgi:hypothetical protein
MVAPKHDTLIAEGSVMTRIFVVVCALALAGCGAAKVDARADARAEYEKSLDDYQACINSNLTNLQKCEESRVLMETNGRTYNNIVAGIKQRTNTAATTQGANTSGAAQGANTANTTQATSSQLPARAAPSTPQSTPSQMPASISPTPQTTSSLPARIPPPPQETVIEGHPEPPVDARSTQTPIPF